MVIEHSLSPKPNAMGMRIAIFHAMALTLLRDRASFALTFVLPPLIFVIFAAVFSAASSGDLSIRMGVIAPQDNITQEIIDGLKQSDLVSELKKYENISALQQSISDGEMDSGIEILRPNETEPPIFRIYFDPVKSGAATIAEAALAAQQPGNNNDEDLDGDDENQIQPAEHISITGDITAIPMAAYYVAGVGMLFVFLSGFQSALSVIEERDSGVMERIAAGPFGVRPMIDGKFAFLIAQGVLQFVVILIVAWLVFRVDIIRYPLPLLITMIAASICAAGVCLCIVGCCRTRSQAHAIGAVIALIMAALGGSMAPRFLMTPEVRTIGAMTPNAWGIDAFGISLWRNVGIEAAYTPWVLLTGTGFLGLGIAYIVMQRTLRAG